MTKIDDEMVERAVQAYHGAYSPRASTSDVIRAALTAALSPKPEPEIEVTQAMKRAGGAVCKFEWQETGHTFEECAYHIYRAMRALEPKAQEGAAYAAKSAPQGVSAAAPVKETGGGVERTHRRSGDGEIVYCAVNGCRFVPHRHFHRRKDDPR